MYELSNGMFYARIMFAIALPVHQKRHTLTGLLPEVVTPERNTIALVLADVYYELLKAFPGLLENDISEE